MAKTKQIEDEATEIVATEEIPRFKGKQLLKLDKFNNRVGRIVFEAEKDYSFDEANEAINNYLRKKG